MSKRILLKLSGESLLQKEGRGIQMDVVTPLAHAIGALSNEGLEVAIVVGGGNLFRAIDVKDTVVERSSADYMGMLATMINGVCLQQALDGEGYSSVVMSALDCPKVAEPYTLRRALQVLEQGHILIFVGGTGNPYFTTDTASALRASEIGVDALLKATKVDGIYSKDPVKYPDAEFYRTLNYSQVLAEKLKVMDATSIALCMSGEIPVYVFNMKHLYEPALIERLEQGLIGTSITT